jgi:hypothetical protein
MCNRFARAGQAGSRLAPSVCVTSFGSADEIPASGGQKKLVSHLQNRAGNAETIVWTLAPTLPRPMSVTPSLASEQMWDWINCHLAGRHEYAVWSDSHRMFLRCLRCGRRSNGWNVADSDEGTTRHVHQQHGDHDHAGHGRLIANALSLLGLSLIGR